jgi:O-6-methylguanine DNA methyltransferase
MDLRSRVLELTSLIPEGRVTTYAELARAAGRPRAWRAVGNLLSRNPRPLRIPCHRVVRSDGRVGGYSLGKRRKVELLRKEGVEVRGGRVDLRRFMFRFSGVPAGG